MYNLLAATVEKAPQQGLSANLEAYQSAIEKLDNLPPTAATADVDAAFQAVERAYANLRHTLIQEGAHYIASTQLL